MDSSEFFDACRSLASSVGEFASLLVVALVSYLLVVVRSLGKRVQASLTSSALPSVRARRQRQPRVGPSSPAPPTAGAVKSPLFLPSKEVPSNGTIPPPVLSPVERLVASLGDEAQPLLPDVVTPALRQRLEDDTHSARSAGPDAAGGPGSGGAPDAGGAASPVAVLVR